VCRVFYSVDRSWASPTNAERQRPGRSPPPSGHPYGGMCELWHAPTRVSNRNGSGPRPVRGQTPGLPQNTLVAPCASGGRHGPRSSTLMASVAETVAGVWRPLSVRWPRRSLIISNPDLGEDRTELQGRHYRRQLSGAQRAAKRTESRSGWIAMLSGVHRGVWTATTSQAPIFPQHPPYGPQTRSSTASKSRAESGISKQI